MIKLDYDFITDILTDYYRRNKEKRTDWLNLQVSATESGYTSFVADYKDYLFLAKHNYQVMVMEHLVNTVLPVTTDIEIVDGSWLDQSYWHNHYEEFIEQEYAYNQSEIDVLSATTGFTQLYLYNGIEFLEDQIDFFVLVNALDSDLESSIIYYIDLFKQAGKNYQIVYI